MQKFSDQETFNTAVMGVINQGRLSGVDGACFYMSDGCDPTIPAGLRCAAGHLLTEDQARRLQKGKFFMGEAVGVPWGVEEDQEPPTLGEGRPSKVRRAFRMLGYNPDLVRKIQRAHDYATDLRNFKHKVIDLAGELGLKIPF